ncbi:Tau-tubulin kinase 1-like [Arapaima gigas]
MISLWWWHWPWHSCLTSSCRFASLQTLSPKHFEQNGLPLPVPSSALHEDDVTKEQAPKREAFGGLPEPRGKRVDFAVFPGALTAPSAEQKDPDKSESSSEASQKSTEHSQDGAPSTLLADDQRESKGLASTVEPDLELEEGSRTLVLFSPGDMRKSLAGGDLHPDVDLGTMATVTPQTEKPQPIGSQLDVSEPGTLSSMLRSEPKPPVAATGASSPFTKVERTFIHIAETSHLNMMSSSGKQARHVDHDLFGVAEEPSAGEDECEEVTKENGELSTVEKEVEENGSVLAADRSEITPQSPVDGPQVENGLDASVENNFAAKEDNVPPLVSLDADQVLADGLSANVPEDSPKVLSEKVLPEEGVAEPVEKAAVCRPPWALHRSRIPVLMSEEDTGSDQSASVSSKERLGRRSKQQQQLARLIMEKHQGRLLRLGSSSVSSGDDGKAASETLSATGSEEDTHDSDRSPARKALGSKSKTADSEKRTERLHSRIPRPVTPVKRPSGSLSSAPPLLSLGSGAQKSTPVAVNRLQVQRTGKAGVNVQSDQRSPPMQSKPRPSPSPALYCGSPRMPPRAVSRPVPYTAAPSAARSLSASPRSYTTPRTDSPSPQRQRRQPANLEARRPLVPSKPRPVTAISTEDSASGPPAGGKPAWRARPSPQVQSLVARGKAATR